jgi:hypothetical protein
MGGPILLMTAVRQKNPWGGQTMHYQVDEHVRRKFLRGEVTA